jgi:transposase
VLVWLVLEDWIEETPGLTSKVLNVPPSLLSFIPRALQVIRVVPTADRVTIEASPRPMVADCPTCGVASTRVHSVYRRVLSDLPWQGRAVTIRVAARRFRCRNRICSRQTFAERLTGVIHPSSRQTERLRDLHRHLAFALGGEAGARLATRLAIPTSPDTLLRLASALSRIGAPARTPRVLGIDDWAWRRGRRYGTVVVDLETNHVVDLLPDREAGTVAAWLRDRPGIEVVARDRAGAYADGIRQGAPAAVQVADRWHLLRNLGEAVQNLTDKHSAAAGRAAQHVRANLRASAASAPPAAMTAATSKPTAAELISMASRARRQSRYEEAARLRSAGASIKRVAAELGAERKTVRRWLRLGHAPLWKQPPSGSILDPFADVLTCRWNEGCRNAAQLWRELVSLGFRGRPSTVRHWVSKHRRDDAGEGKIAADPLPPIWPVPRGYRLARLLMSGTSRLTAEDELFRTKLLEDEPALAAAVAWAQQFNALLRRKINGDLGTILAAAADTMLARFAAGLRRDFAAISASLELPWTTSPVEGQISRLKMLKRTMYGRAGFELLRARVLNAA